MSMMKVLPAVIAGALYSGVAARAALLAESGPKVIGAATLYVAAIMIVTGLLNQSQVRTWAGLCLLAWVNMGYNYLTGTGPNQFPFDASVAIITGACLLLHRRGVARHA